ncbi:putative minor capsid protein [Helcococcus kunzii]|uniref:putative minor capsid protein n=1 Tax=Helcococcus kunzii TaxID=40091 RepID=UPI0038A79850
MISIKKRLLIHECVYLQPKNNDVWNDDEHKRVELKNVRIEPKRGYLYTGTGEKITYNAILFWDAVHSTHVVFDLKGKILFNGREMNIVTVSEFYDDRKLHHVEVMLT